MDPLLVTGIILTFVIIGILVYWFVLRNPSSNTVSCTSGTDCSSNVSTKDPNWLSYLWDSSCNCNLASCKTGFTLTNGACVADSSGSPGQKCTPGYNCIPTSPVPNGNWYSWDSSCNNCVVKTCRPPYVVQNGLCVMPGSQGDTQISGLVDAESWDTQTIQKDLSSCANVCAASLTCKVYDYDSVTKQCTTFNDYRSVSGYGGLGSHYIDNVDSTGGTRSTFVRPFSSKDPEMGTGKMAIVQGAKVAQKPYRSVLTGGLYQFQSVANQCLSDPSCQAVTCGSSSIGGCDFFKQGVSYTKDIVGADSTIFSFLKMSPTS